MDDYTPDDVREARRPIASLISKSEKAQRKLTPGTWQYSMLRDNLRALHIAADLFEGRALDDVIRSDLQEALEACASMIGRTEKSYARFAPGTSQHTLLRNRLKALRIAEALIRQELDDR